jgi:hypothetical protein
MDDPDIVKEIGRLADEERRLEETHAGDGLSEEDHAQLRRIEVTLDQLWDLLRQRRALRDAGRSPTEAVERAPDVVEHYLQ